MRLLGPFLLFTDLGFIVYWSVTVFGLIPAEYTFAGYHDPVLVAWNWSFLPLDLLVSATGLAGVWLHKNGDRRWRGLVLVGSHLVASQLVPSTLSAVLRSGAAAPTGGQAMKLSVFDP